MNANITPVAFIQRTVAKRYGIPQIEMVSQRRDRLAYQPRHIAYYLARELTPFSLPRIARLFGDRDHTTIMHGIRRVEQRIANEPETAQSISTLRAEIEAALSVDNSISVPVLQQPAEA